MKSISNNSAIYFFAILLPPIMVVFVNFLVAKYGGALMLPYLALISFVALSICVPISLIPEKSKRTKKIFVFSFFVIMLTYVLYILFSFYFVFWCFSLIDDIMFNGVFH